MVVKRNHGRICPMDMVLRVWCRASASSLNANDLREIRNDEIRGVPIRGLLDRVRHRRNVFLGLLRHARTQSDESLRCLR